MPMPSSRLTQRHRLPKLLLGLLLGLLLTLGGGWAAPPAPAQFSNPFAGGSSTLPPAGVQRIGLLEVTSATLDGMALFDIASPAVFNRNESRAEVPVEVRARQVEANLIQVVDHALELIIADELVDSSSLDVAIEIIGGQPVLVAAGAGLEESRVLLTVTGTDAQYHGLSATVLADRWQDTLRDALQRAIRSRLPEARQQQIRRTLWILLASVLLTLALTGCWQVLGWRKSALEKRQAAQETMLLPPADAEAESLGQQLQQLFSYQVTLAQRLQIVAFLRWLMFWGIAFVWVTGTASVLYLFPQTRGYAFKLFSIPVLLLVAWFVTGLLNRLANIGIEQIAQAWGKNELGDLDDMQQKSMRISTITGVLKGLKTAIVYSVARVLIMLG